MPTSASGISIPSSPAVVTTSTPEARLLEALDLQDFGRGSRSDYELPGLDDFAVDLHCPWGNEAGLPLYDFSVVTGQDVLVLPLP